MRFRHISYIVLTFFYLLGIRNGYIALWEGDDPEPVITFPYLAASLPEQDRDRLTSGIYIEKESDLLQLLEDYLS